MHFKSGAGSRWNPVCLKPFSEIVNVFFCSERIIIITCTILVSSMEENVPSMSKKLDLILFI